jgi:hypothetical protein
MPDVAQRGTRVDIVIGDYHADSESWTGPEVGSVFVRVLELLIPRAFVGRHAPFEVR